MAIAKEQKRYRSNLQDETDSAFLYRALSAAEATSELKSVYAKLAATEERHAEFWRERLAKENKENLEAGTIRPSWRARMLARLARRFGAGFVLPTLVGMERSGGSGYGAQAETRGTGMAGEEEAHGRILQTLAASTGRGVAGGTVARLEGRHGGVGGNALRAAVLGANDGLVSNLSLVMGVAGAELSGASILITGLAGLLAGAISMALGEWLSVQSSRELNVRQLAVEREELAAAPEEEAEELALIYQAKGIEEDEARRLADQITSAPERALDTLAREELGIDPEELGGSAWEAAFTSFFLFALGAVIPVFPFFFLTGWSAVGTSIAVSAAGLFAIGAGITLMTGRGVLFSGGRQMLFGLVAAAVTFGIGHLVGVSVGG